MDNIKITKVRKFAINNWINVIEVVFFFSFLRGTLGRAGHEAMNMWSGIKETHVRIPEN
jgi:hypothetical protein